MTNWLFEYKAILAPYTSSIKSGTVIASSLEEANKIISDNGWTPVTLYAVRPVTEEVSVNES